MQCRTERDPLGEYAVPADAYYGIQTARAADNFPISGLRAQADLVTATILVKKAAAQANIAFSRIDAGIGDAIVRAADEVLAGALRDQFLVDVYQASAGTSHNMNANEVLANRAAEIAKESMRTGRTIRDIVIERGLMDTRRFDQVLSAEQMTRPGIAGEVNL